MEIRFKMSAADHLEALAYVRNSAVKRSRFRMLPFFSYMICTAIITIGILIIYHFIETQDDPGTIIAKYSLFGIIVGIIILFILQPSLFNRLLSDAFFDSEGVILSENIFRIEPAFLIQNVKKSEYLTSWDDIIRIEETSKYIFLFIDNIAAYYIPKSAFKDKGELEAFLNMLKENCKMRMSLK